MFIQYNSRHWIFKMKQWHNIYKQTGKTSLNSLKGLLPMPANYSAVLNNFILGVIGSGKFIEHTTTIQVNYKSEMSAGNRQVLTLWEAKIAPAHWSDEIILKRKHVNVGNTSQLDIS